MQNVKILKHLIIDYYQEMEMETRGGISGRLVGGRSVNRLLRCWMLVELIGGMLCIEEMIGGSMM